MIHWVKHWGLAKSKYFAKFATYALAVLAEAWHFAARCFDWVEHLWTHRDRSP
jgi:hypothetical protein